jgi:hypothetical protein
MSLLIRNVVTILVWWKWRNRLKAQNEFVSTKIETEPLQNQSSYFCTPLLAQLIDLTVYRSDMVVPFLFIYVLETTMNGEQ